MAIKSVIAVFVVLVYHFSMEIQGDQMQLQKPLAYANAVVSQDGSGDFLHIMDAVNAAPNYPPHRYVIYIKRGRYFEYVTVNERKSNLMFIGDGMDDTIISGNRSNGTGWSTLKSATVSVFGNGFIARDLTIENTAGPQNNQAVALLSKSDKSVFFRCGIHGYQDTLYAHFQNQFYRECRISGTVDFIFGQATVVFQQCQILARKGLLGQHNTITAQGRDDPKDTDGFSFQFCNITVDPNLLSSGSSSTYLGRPWQLFSRTVFMQCYLSDVINPKGWLEWQGHFALDTLYYGEYRNEGPGAALNDRVKWHRFHAIRNSSEAEAFTVAKFIDGDSWLPSTGVNYTPGF